MPQSLFIWFWSSLFKLLLEESLHIDPLIKPLPIWPHVPFNHYKKLWKIEFDTDFHLSNCSKSPFILILWCSLFLFGLNSLFIITKSFGKSSWIKIFTFQTTTQRPLSYWSIDEAPSYLASSPFSLWQKALENQIWFWSSIMKLLK